MEPTGSYYENRTCGKPVCKVLEFHICSGDRQKKQEQRYKTDDEHYNEITVGIHFAPLELARENIL